MYVSEVQIRLRAVRVSRRVGVWGWCGLLEGLYGDLKGSRRDRPKVNPTGRTDTNLPLEVDSPLGIAPLRRNVRLRNNLEGGNVMRDFT